MIPSISTHVYKYIWIYCYFAIRQWVPKVLCLRKVFIIFQRRFWFLAVFETWNEFPKISIVFRLFKNNKKKILNNSECDIPWQCRNPEVNRSFWLYCRGAFRESFHFNESRLTSRDIAFTARGGKKNIIVILQSFYAYITVLKYHRTRTIVLWKSIRIIQVVLRHVLWKRKI